MSITYLFYLSFHTRSLLVNYRHITQNYFTFNLTIPVICNHHPPLTSPFSSLSLKPFVLSLLSLNLSDLFYLTIRNLSLQPTTTHLLLLFLLCLFHSPYLLLSHFTISSDFLSTMCFIIFLHFLHKLCCLITPLIKYINLSIRTFLYFY